MVAAALTGAGNVTSLTSNSASSLAGTKPANIANGDLLWAVFYHRNASGTITVPSGWTNHKTEGGNGTWNFATKPITNAAGEPATYTFSTSTGSNRCVLVIGRITGADLTTPLDAVGATSVFTGTTSLVHPSVTAAATGCLLLAVSTNNTSSGTVAAFTADGAMTQVAQHNVNTGAATSNVQVAQQTLAASGASGTRTASISPAAGNSGGFLVTIRSGAVEIGRVTGTGTAQALAAARTHALARATGTGLAQAVATFLSHPLGRVTSTGSAQPLAASTQVGGRVQLPTLFVEVAFSTGAATGGLLTLDDPTRGKLDIGALGTDSSPDPVWTDITEWVYPGSITRGSTRVDSPIVTYDTGTLTLTLDNSDRRFDPDHLDGPYTRDSDELSGEQVTLNTNTGFESGTTGWTGFGGTFTQASDEVHTGAFAGKITPNGVSLFVSIDADQVPVEAGQTYQASAWVRNAVARNVFLKIDWFDAAAAPLASVFSSPFAVSAATWARLTFSAIAPANAVSGNIVVLMGGSDGVPPATDVLWVDEAEFAHLPYRRVTQVTAMRAVRVRALWDDVHYELFSGHADLWAVEWHDPGDSTCVLTASDPQKVLAGIDRAALELPVGGGELSGARVSRILDSADWPAADRIIAAGDSTLQETTLEGDVLSELQTVAVSELGELYADGGGRIVFRNRNAIITDPRSNTSQATFGDGIGEMPYQDLGLANDDATFFNEIRVTAAGGTEQLVTDSTSQALYYRKTYKAPTDPIIETDEAALNYASWLLHIAADPEQRFTEIRIAPTDDPAELYPHALGRELGDRITIIRRPPGGGDPSERDCFIRGIKHEWDGTSWLTTWVLQDASRHGSFFVLDNTALGRLDLNAIAY